MIRRPSEETLRARFESGIEQMLGVPVMLSEHVRIDRALVLGPEGNPSLLIKGLRPLTPIEQAGVDAVRIVREGMADVLAWLGEGSPTP